eukprot:m.256384 g.256384  ORF g.256384 m.256384 type:complete len:270 (-) comp11017_c1_seq9:2112-2921(-)
MFSPSPAVFAAAFLDPNSAGPPSPLAAWALQRLIAVPPALQAEHPPHHHQQPANHQYHQHHQYYQYHQQPSERGINTKAHRSSKSKPRVAAREIGATPAPPTLPVEEGTDQCLAAVAAEAVERDGSGSSTPAATDDTTDTQRFRYTVKELLRIGRESAATQIDQAAIPPAIRRGEADQTKAKRSKGKGKQQAAPPPPLTCLSPTENEQWAEALLQAHKKLRQFQAQLPLGLFWWGGSSSQVPKTSSWNHDHRTLRRSGKRIICLLKTIS